MIERVLVAGRFVVGKLAGQGGMGSVYRAIDALTGKPVALKILHNVTGESTRRFAREVRVLEQVSGLGHRAFPRYVAHGTDEAGAPFVATEWLEGEDLATRLARGPLTLAETCALACALAEGLSTLHAHGIVHCDVKPANIFLVGGDPARAKLLDFGIVRTLDDHAAADPVASGIFGTVGYMAPEQADTNRMFDGRADVFALGCVLFECFAGYAAFTGSCVWSILSMVLFQGAPHLRDARADLPAEMSGLVDRMLSGSPEDRPRLSEVTRVLAGVAPTIPPPAILRSEKGLDGDTVADVFWTGHLRLRRDYGHPSSQRAACAA